MKLPPATRPPRITSRQLLRALRKLGWSPTAQRGSHVQLTHPDRSGRVTVAAHAGETLKPKTLAAILEQAGVTVDELRDTL